MRINAIWYPIRQWEEAKRFYGDLLGLQVTYCNDDAGWVSYATGAVPLFLVRQPERAGVAGGACVTLACADLTAMRERLAAAGVRVVEGRTDLRIVTIYDPDGNMLDISEPVKQQ